MITKDNYVLKLHRILHPSASLQKSENAESASSIKKPYLILHGLLGSSASFVRSMRNQANYEAPSSTFDTKPVIEEMFAYKANSYETSWRSTADRFEKSHDGVKSIFEQNHKSLKNQIFKKLLATKQYCSINDLDFDNDSESFGRNFKQAYRKFELPTSSQRHITNSLALTLSNFGYDVWLANLRGNQYSRAHNGGVSDRTAEFWNFDIDTLIREDLPATINKIRQTTNYQEPIGLVSYSYSNLYVLGLLAKFPVYQEMLQPLIMMAPTTLNGSGQSTRYRAFLRLSTALLIAKNGPFPERPSKEDWLERLVCKLPVASKLCHLFESLLAGQSRALLKDHLQTDDINWLSRKDIECGQTSKAVLHQIIENLGKDSIHPKYNPFVNTRSSAKQRRRSIMLIHSESDEIATIQDVAKIRDSTIKGLALIDLVIKEANFNHADFLFAPSNQYLVNGEIARMASLFDYMIAKKS